MGLSLNVSSASKTAASLCGNSRITSSISTVPEEKGVLFLL